MCFIIFLPLDHLHCSVMTSLHPPPLPPPPLFFISFSILDLVLNDGGMEGGSDKREREKEEEVKGEVEREALKDSSVFFYKKQKQNHCLPQRMTAYLSIRLNCLGTNHLLLA